MQNEEGWRISNENAKIRGKDMLLEFSISYALFVEYCRSLRGVS